MIPEDHQRQLLLGLRKGDIFSFEELFRIYNRKIFSYSLKYLRNKEDAEGVVQHVFLELWRNREKFRKDSRLDSWLFTVTFNAIRKVFRKAAIERKHLEIYLKENKGRQIHVPEFEYFDSSDIARKLIDRLPPQQKKIFLMRTQKGMSCEEMAGELELSKKTVENHLNRARSYLKKCMIAEGIISLIILLANNC